MVEGDVRYDLFLTLFRRNPAFHTALTAVDALAAGAGAVRKVAALGHEADEGVGGWRRRKNNK